MNKFLFGGIAAVACAAIGFLVYQGVNEQRQAVDSTPASANSGRSGCSCCSERTPGVAVDASSSCCAGGESASACCAGEAKNGSCCSSTVSTGTCTGACSEGGKCCKDEESAETSEVSTGDKPACCKDGNCSGSCSGSCNGACQKKDGAEQSTGTDSESAAEGSNG